MSEVGFLNGMELPEPKLPDVFDYDASVIRLQDFRHKTGEGFKKLMQELWIARECLAVITGRPRKVKSRGPKARTWMEYLEEVGLARSTVHKWLTNFFPGKDRKISLPTKPAPKLPPKSSTSERVAAAAGVTDGIGDQALGNAMENREWNGENKESGGEITDKGDGTVSVAAGIGDVGSAKPDLDLFVCTLLTNLRVKIAEHVNKDKVQKAQKLLSELFMLFSEG